MGEPYYDVDFNKVFCNLIEEKDNLSFYSKRRRYYNFFSPNCSVYTLLKIFEKDYDKILGQNFPYWQGSL